MKIKPKHIVAALMVIGISAAVISTGNITAFWFLILPMMLFA